MPLDLAVARDAIDQWRLDARPDWDDQDVGSISAALVALSAELTPLITQGEALDEDRRQHYLVIRVVDELNGWLARAASGLRALLGADAPTPAPFAGATPIGLRTATRTELEALPVIGRTTAAAIARMARMHPDVTQVDDFEALDAVGPHTLEVLRERTYLDRPSVSLASGPVIAFAARPNVTTYLRVLATSDLELVVADGATLRRRPPAGGSQAERLLRLIALVTDNASIVRSPASGAAAQDAARLVARRRLRESYLARLHRADGAVLTNQDYVAAAAKLINEATDRIRLMVFLGTDTAGDELHPGPLVLVEALEARAAVGVDVRVLLDQDDGGEPYRSVFINQPLVDRLRANNVDVRFDPTDVLLHSKVLAVDGAAVIVGSHNWTKTGFNAAHELSLLISSAETAGEYEARFAELWESVGP